MKIAFTGSHSTGKTTLLKEVTRISKSQKVLVIPEIARKLIDEGLPLAKEATTESFNHYVNRQFRAERELSGLNFDLLISDRTTLDSYGYVTVNKRLSIPNIPDYFIEMLLEVGLRNAQFYDLFVFFPVEFEMTIDSVRPIDPIYREEVGAVIKDCLKKFHIPHIEVTGSTNQRLEILRSNGILK